MNTSAPTQATTLDADFLRTLEVERTQAIVARDMPAIERLHAPDYELISPPGRVMTRERYLSLIAAEPFYAKWEHGEMRVRFSEGMAAVRYRAKITFPSGRVVDWWHTDIYELQAGSWKAVWSQATQLAPNSPPSTGAL
ncbi:MAG TPA: nuclear transport factor 2 family protein [Candidatus Acidoferrales bacterium]|nr:nuclear transport factor 2 family protein [Candidatus Acidoferrales bacterium]